MLCHDFIIGSDLHPNGHHHNKSKTASVEVRQNSAANACMPYNKCVVIYLLLYVCQFKWVPFSLVEWQGLKLYLCLGIFL